MIADDSPTEADAGEDAAAVAPWTMLATRVLAPNPGPMTLEGTNTYVIRNPDSHGIVVVDPGPSAAAHMRRIMAQGRVELILLTHHHADHSGAAARLSAVAGAPVRAADPAHCRFAEPLRDGEEIIAGGTSIRVLHMPGHTADSVCFELRHDRRLEDGMPARSVLTGDTILGRGTTVLDGAGGGRLVDYLETLRRLEALGSGPVLPGHGPMLDNLAVVAAAYTAHRERRLGEIERAVAQLETSPRPVTVETITDLVYGELAPKVRVAAEASVAVHLGYLADQRSAGTRRTTGSDNS